MLGFPFFELTSTVVLVGGFFLVISLVLAPLFIWKWTKATTNEIEKLNHNVAIIAKALRKETEEDEQGS
jgi:HAMP domain-containing protein